MQPHPFVDRHAWLLGQAQRAAGEGVARRCAGRRAGGGSGGALLGPALRDNERGRGHVILLALDLVPLLKVKVLRLGA